jgi:hypothetical protein
MEESDIDADAETDPGHEHDLDFELSSSDESSTSSTVSSGTSSSASLGFATNGRNHPCRDDDDESYRDTDEEMVDYRAPKRIATAGARDRRRGRGRRVNHQKHGDIETSRRARKHAQRSSNARLMCEMTAAHALISLLHDATSSDVDGDIHNRLGCGRSLDSGVKNNLKGSFFGIRLNHNPSTGSGQKRRRASA